MNDAEPESLDRRVDSYEVAGGTEHFVSIEDPEQDLLVGFCRLREPGDPRRSELQDAAIVRELHVYGSEVAIDADSSDEGYQHEGYGTQLMAEAERIAREAGYEKLSVISGIGAREYYRSKLGYYQDGPYVATRL